MRKLTLADFLQKAHCKYGDIYSYSKAKYVNYNTKICITCPVHGDFWQTPHLFISGRCCSKCSIEKANLKKKGKAFKKLTQQDFLSRASAVHPEYNYSASKYVNMKTKVSISCTEHGAFSILPGNLFRGCGCPKCKVNKRPNTLEWITKAGAMHKNKYTYSKSVYVNCRTKVCITCPVHGDFWQKPADHIIGHGCPKCSSNKFLSKKEAVERASEVHDGKYDYSLVSYYKLGDKVKIICPEHGIFKQSFERHLKGCGCPVCKSSKGERKIRDFLSSKGLEEGKDFFRQKKFKECKNRKCLPFDFYIPSKNLLIEYQGEQHYRPIGIFGGADGLKKIKANDKTKQSFAQANAFRLLEIPYSNCKNIESILQKELNI